MRAKLFSLGLALSFFYLNSAYPAESSDSVISPESATGKVVSATMTTGRIADFYALEYTTTALDGSPTVATGVIAVPRTAWPKKLDLVSYQHGTEAAAVDAPSSSPNQGGDSYYAITGFLARGYIVVAADGLGLGKHRSFHPLLHAETEATASADMLKAAYAFFKREGIFKPRHLFLSGYSQGGQWTLALHRHLEAHPELGLKVAASFPMDGPYDLSKTMVEQIVYHPGGYTSFYAAYALFSMQGIYQDIYTDPREGFVDDIADEIATLFDGKHHNREIKDRLSNDPYEVLRPEFLREVGANPNHPLRLDMAKNDVYDWTPIAPVYLIHSRGDTTVPFKNAEVAYESFRSKGATVELIPTLGNLDHPAAFVPAMREAMKRMDEFVANHPTPIQALKRRWVVSVKRAL